VLGFGSGQPHRLTQRLFEPVDVVWIDQKSTVEFVGRAGELRQDQGAA
jgi:hypothetical protein